MRPGAESVDLDAHVWQALVDDPLKPTECTLDQPGAIAGLQFLQDLVYKYGYAPQPEALAEMGTNDLC